MVNNYYRTRFIFIVFCLLGLANSVHARNWQLMLIPESASFSLENASQDQQFNANVNRFVKSGLSQAISNSLETLIESESVFNTCEQKWCAQPSLDSLAKTILEQATKVELLVLYSVNNTNTPFLKVRLLDPISFKVYFDEQLPISLPLGQKNLIKAGRELGDKLLNRLQNVLPKLIYDIRFEQFKFDELNGISTYILSNPNNGNFELKNSIQSNLLFNQYLPVISSQFSLETALTATQLKLTFERFFEQYSIDVNISFLLDDSRQANLTIRRVGHPYAPSMVSSTVIFCIVISLLGLSVRRQYLDYYLTEYSQKRDADAWLAMYSKASKPIYFLSSKWVSQASYWQRLQQESIDLFKQSKTYFDAGDLNTAKLFVSKALYTNSANQHAKSLVKSIEEFERNSQSLSKNEQWIRNRLAKAMNNYREQQPIKALRRLYQAVAVGKKEKALKRQVKAINRLIKQIKQEFKTPLFSLTINSSIHPTSYVLCQNQNVHIGRLPNNREITWVSPQDSVFYINHKLVSRLGQHCYIKNDDEGFFIQDLGSKNGTFINSIVCEHGKSNRLVHNDFLQLGGKNPVTSVGLNIEIDQNNKTCKLRFDDQAMSLLDRSELNNIWPDNALAVRTELVCIRQKCVLVYDNATKTIDLVSETAPLAKTMLALCIITLGEGAFIAPANDKFIKNEQLTLENLPLLGEVPIILPCNIQFKDLVVQLTEYDSSSIRYGQAALLENNSVGASSILSVQGNEQVRGKAGNGD